MKLQKILVVYTGGTFGMRSQPSQRNSLQPKLEIPNLSATQLEAWLKKQVPEMMQIADCDIDVLFNLDSCQFQAHHWFELAAHLHEKLKGKHPYRGVVILHGTDTLAYTASALSFLLSPAPLPIVITGAQKPLAMLRNDARSNLISALEVAAHAPKALQNRVMVVFHDEVFLGSRVRKKSALDFAAFESPRFPKLASIGSQIQYHDVIHHLPKLKRTRPLLTEFVHHLGSGGDWKHTPQILSTQVTPEFCSRLFTYDVLENLDAGLLTLFTSGTAPTAQPSFLNFLKHAKETETLILAITEREDETPSLDTYASGRDLLKSGVIWCKDLTPESAFVKMWLLKELHSNTHRDRFYAWIHRYWKVPISDECSR